MTRVLLIAASLALPFVLYGVYAWWVHLKAEEAKTAGKVWSDAPWTWLIVTSVVLFIVAVIGYGLAPGEKSSGAYVPPRTVDGKVAPAEVK